MIGTSFDACGSIPALDAVRLKQEFFTYAKERNVINKVKDVIYKNSFHKCNKMILELERA